jgi:hypothetical protein
MQTTSDRRDFGAEDVCRMTGNEINPSRHFWSFGLTLCPHAVLLQPHLRIKEGVG